MNYRGVINMLVMCGCVGQSGGGWSHYVGQEKLRPQTGWMPLAFALDWGRPPRQHEFDVVLLRAHRPVALRDGRRSTRYLSPTAPAGPWDGALDRLQRSRRTHGLAAVGAAAQAESARGCEEGASRRTWSRRTMSPRRSSRASCRWPARIRTIRPTGRATCSSGARTCSARPARATNISSSTCSAPRMA